MAMMPAARRQRLAELQALIEGYVATNRYIRTNLENPIRVEEEISRLEDLVKKTQDEVSRLKQSLANGPNNIRINMQAIMSIRSEIVRLRYEDQISELLELTKKLGTTNDQ